MHERTYAVVILLPCDDGDGDNSRTPNKAKVGSSSDSNHRSQDFTAIEACVYLS